MKRTFVTLGLLALASCAEQQPAESPENSDPVAEPAAVAAPTEQAASTTVETAPAKPAPATAEERAKFFQDCWSAFNAKDWAKFSTCYAENATSEQVDSGIPKSVGRSQIVENGGKLYVSQFPDMNGEAELTLVNGNHIAAVLLLKGTNTGPLQSPVGSTPATNKKIGILAGQSINLTEDGRSAQADRFYFDSTSFMGQLGVLGPKPPPHRLAIDKGWADKKIVVATNSDTEKANLAAFDKGLELFNKHDVAGLVGTMTDDVTFSDSAAPKDTVGKKAVETSFKQMFKAFSDVKLEVTSKWTAGDYVVSEGTFAGTNDGDMPSMGLKKTGKKVSAGYLEIDKIENGKVKNMWLFDNGMAFATQLGLIPQPGADTKAPAKTDKATKPAAATPATGTPAATPTGPSPTGKKSP